VVIVMVAMAVDYVPTPFGFTPRNCMHSIPLHSKITESDDGRIWIADMEDGREYELSPKCRQGAIVSKNPQRRPDAPDVYDGWLAYTSWNYSAGIDTFLGDFTVPHAPQKTPQVLYLFTGLQNVNWIPVVDDPPLKFDIIQPVLQYPGDRGLYWSVKSWYVTLTNDVLASTEVQVSVGDTIFGNMTRVNQDTFFIGSTQVSTGKTTSLTVTRSLLESQPWAYCTAEGYGVTGCTNEPDNTVVFSKMTMTNNKSPLNYQWTSFQSPTPKCYEVAHINTPSVGDVTISFQKQ